MATMISLLSLALLTPSILAMDYGRSFLGEGTYYGTTEAGNCALRQPRPAMYANLQPVALNAPQYGDSLPCGACIEYEGTGHGSGANPIPNVKKIGYIMDKCPECPPNAIDLSMSGDGKWGVKWKFVECPGNTVSFLFEGSNYWYWKVQPRGLKTPAKFMSMTVNGKEIIGRRTDDNFFILESGGWDLPVYVKIFTVGGMTVNAKLDGWKENGVVFPVSQSGGGAPAESRAGTRPPTTKPPPPPPTQAQVQHTQPQQTHGGGGYKWWRPNQGKCVPRWRACSGPNNRWGTGKCCGPFRCVYAKDPHFVGKRCEPYIDPPAKCTPKWKACTGPYNFWRTRTCCDGWVCRIPSTRPFVGKRCEPPKHKRHW